MGRSQILRKPTQKTNAHPPRVAKTNTTQADWNSSTQETKWDPTQASVTTQQRGILSPHGNEHKPNSITTNCQTRPSRRTNIQQAKTHGHTIQSSFKTPEASEIKKPHLHSKKHPPTKLSANNGYLHPVKTLHHGKIDKQRLKRQCGRQTRIKQPNKQWNTHTGGYKT